MTSRTGCNRDPDLPTQHFVRRATYEDAEAITALRQAAYRDAQDFTLRNGNLLDQLAWGAEDERGDVLGVWSEGSLVATMRCDILQDPSAARTHFDGMPVPDHHEAWPAPLLCRGATVRSRASAGLNSLLRLHFIEAAISSGYHRLYGYVVAGGSRTRLMEALGYEFQSRQDADPEWASPLPWAMAWLDLRERGPAAAAHLKVLCAEEQDRHPWIGPEFKMGTCRKLGCGP